MELGYMAKQTEQALWPAATVCHAMSITARHAAIDTRATTQYGFAMQIKDLHLSLNIPHLHYICLSLLLRSSMGSPPYIPTLQNHSSYNTR
ncbi:hypothetical protein RvY_06127 [Ramazzottius varieornatus]|uniref:Uncharacterized protein n=1 Tax=Ramazzottius varieornatus TaxID=947166 RepID=A0A1D1V113_RAMVA|nr:hypothetical protein RvY_06127 [Ramazzottius varieornatus]